MGKIARFHSENFHDSNNCDNSGTFLGNNPNSQHIQGHLVPKYIYFVSFLMVIRELHVCMITETYQHTHFKNYRQFEHHSYHNYKQLPVPVQFLVDTVVWLTVLLCQHCVASVCNS